MTGGNWGAREVHSKESILSCQKKETSKKRGKEPSETWIQWNVWTGKGEKEPLQIPSKRKKKKRVRPG